MKWSFKPAQAPGQINRVVRWALWPKKCFTDQFKKEFCIIWLEPYEKRFRLQRTGMVEKQIFEGNYVMEKKIAPVILFPPKKK